MTTTLTRVMHCDHPGCDAQAVAGPRWVAEREDGWADCVHTHGCPEHGEAIRAHWAKVTSQTRGRGRSEKTTWFLECACGWRPSPGWQTHSATGLHEQHKRHVAATLACPPGPRKADEQEAAADE